MSERRRLSVLSVLAMAGTMPLVAAPKEDAGWGVWLAYAGVCVACVTAWAVVLWLFRRWLAAGKLPSVERFVGEE